MDFAKFFNPSSVAVIGASATRHKLGNDIILNLLKGKKRTIYPINPSHKNINRLKCYSSISDIRNNIDLVIIVVKSSLVPNILEECGKKGIKNVIIISAGFKEIGKEGTLLEYQIKEIAIKYNIKILGPNCLGMIDTYSNINASFAPYMPKKGGIGFLSQSGAVCTAMLDMASSNSIGFSKFISLGNETILSEADFLQIMLDDKDTKSIMMYLETISDGEKLINVIKKSKTKKPIVILKTGRTVKASKAMMSHTGSIAGDHAVFDAICRQYGIINISSISEMYDLARLFSSGVYTSMKNILILTNAGGPSVIATDMIASSSNVSMVELSQSTKDILRSILPREAAVNNPVDIIGDATSKRYEVVLKNIINIKFIDAILLIVTPQSMTDALNIAKLIKKYNVNKPIISVFIGGEKLSEAKKFLNQNHLPVFDFLQNAIKAIDNIAEIDKNIARPNFVKTKKMLQHTIDKSLLPAQESITLLKKYNIPHLETYILKTLKDVDKLKLKYPVVVKADNIMHKSDVGAVKLNINSKEEIKLAWKTINNFKDTILIQPMINGSIELIIGVKKDDVFGYIVLFGLGGIFVEIYKDISIKKIPLTIEDIDDMIYTIKGYEILAGARGQQKVNIDAIKQTILNLSKLVIENSNISEIDFNPVMVNEKNVYVVDAKIILDIK